MKAPRRPGTDIVMVAVETRFSSLPEQLPARDHGDAVEYASESQLMEGSGDHPASAFAA